MNVYEQVTQRIIAQLENGVIPWRKEWKSAGHSSLPTNFTTKKPYRGINVLLLLSACCDDPRFMTYKQAQAIGAQVRKGEHGTPIVFWSTFERDEDEDAKRIPFLRTYTVFHISQVNGIPAELPFDAPPFEPIPAAQAIADGYLSREHLTLRHGGDRAFYSSTLDYIQMPHQAAFVSPDSYYSTLFHEMSHSTGHRSRLDRRFDNSTKFGDETYSKEELVAEFSAAYLCAETGISNALVEANHAAYIQSWLRALKNDKTLLISAAQKAQHAADRISDRRAAARDEEQAVAA